MNLYFSSWTWRGPLSQSIEQAAGGVRCALPFQIPQPPGLSPLLARQLTEMNVHHNHADAIKSKKHAMRNVIRSKLSAMTDADIVAESKRVWSQVLDIPEYKEAQSVGIFLSMPFGEIRTDDVIVDAAENGKRVFVPNIIKSGATCEMEMLEVPREELTSGSISSWPRNKWQIPEPPMERAATFAVAQAGDIDLFIVPGLAFDRKGNRLGQGKGYYDRYFRRMRLYSEGSNANNGRREPGKAFFAAVGLQCQLVDEVPVQDFDQPMDLIATPGELVLIPKRVV